MNHHEAWLALSEAIITKAIEDVKMLKSRGLIVNGRAPKSWPTTAMGQPRIVCDDFRSVSDVKRLLHFFHSGTLAEMIDDAGFDIDANLIIKGLGIQEKDENKD